MLSHRYTLRRRRPYVLLESEEAAVLWHENRAQYIALDTAARRNCAQLIEEGSDGDAGVQSALEPRFDRSRSPSRAVPFPDRRYSTYFATLNITDDCNLACRYCYARAGERHNFMPIEVGIEVYRLMLRFDNRRVRFLFHGGEPLMNWRFIAAFTEYVRGPGRGPKEVNLCLQTNGTLVTRDIARFLNENEVGVGVSLDGIDEAANGMRVTKCGSRPTLRPALEGLRILLDQGCEPGVISVVTTANYRQVPAMIDFLVREGVRDFTLNPLILAGRGSGSTARIGVDQYIRMTTELIAMLAQINASGVARVTERNLQYLVLNIVSNERRYMCLRSPCGAATNLLGFGPNGDVYPCDDFHGVAEFKIGNVLEDDIVAAVRNGTTACQFTRRTVDSYPTCGECPWRWVCNAGGCASRRYFATGSLESPDPLCPYFQWLIPQILLDLGSGGLEAQAFLAPQSARFLPTTSGAAQGEQRVTGISVPSRSDAGDDRFASPATPPTRPPPHPGGEIKGDVR